LIGEAGEKPFEQSDWITPPAKPTQQPFQVGTLLPLIFAEPEPPFMEIKWPVPPAKPTQQPFQVGSPYVLIGEAGEKPFDQLDWITPPAKPTQQPFQVGTQLPTAEVFDAFFQHDWPNPTVDIKIQTPFQVGSPYVLIGETGEKPFAQTDWITPPAIPTTHLEQISMSVALVPEELRGGDSSKLALRLLMPDEQLDRLLRREDDEILAMIIAFTESIDE